MGLWRKRKGVRGDGAAGAHPDENGWQWIQGPYGPAIVAKPVRRKPHTLLIILLVLLGIVVAWEGSAFGLMKLFSPKPIPKDEMSAIAHSEDAKRIYDKSIRIWDTKAYTPEGVIQSYAVDDDSTELNQVGKILVKLIVNDDERLYIQISLSRDVEEHGTRVPLSGGASGGSGLLDKMIRDNGSSGFHKPEESRPSDKGNAGMTHSGGHHEYQ